METVCYVSLAFFLNKKKLKFKLTKEKCIQIIHNLVINVEWRKTTISIFQHPNHFLLHRFLKLGGTFAALKTFISRSRIPDWITYQSSGSEVKAKLPSNWFNSNFLGFAFSFIIFGHFSRMFMLKTDVSFDWTSSDDSFPIDIMIFDMIFYKRRLKSDHVCLFYVPLPQWRNCSQVTRIKVSFMAYSKEGKI